MKRFDRKRLRYIRAILRRGPTEAGYAYFRARRRRRNAGDDEPRLLPSDRLVLSAGFAVSAEEVEANALADPDSAPETEEEIAAAWGAEYVQQVRSRLSLTQAEFSERFHVPLGTLRDWERGASVPDTSARTLLRVIAREPEAVLRALAS